MPTGVIPYLTIENLKNLVRFCGTYIAQMGEPPIGATLTKQDLGTS